jgi:hypothetical protein
MSKLQGEKAPESQMAMSPPAGGLAGKDTEKKSGRPPTGGRTGKHARKKRRGTAAVYYVWAKGQRRKEGKRQQARGQRRQEGKQQAAVDFAVEPGREEEKA